MNIFGMLQSTTGIVYNNNDGKDNIPRDYYQIIMARKNPGHPVKFEFQINNFFH